MLKLILRQLQRIIKALRYENKLQVLFTILLLISGIVIMYFAYRKPEGIWEELPKSILALGSSLIASILGFPIAEILRRKSKIKILKGFEIDLLDSETPKQGKKTIEDNFWKILIEILKK